MSELLGQEVISILGGLDSGGDAPSGTITDQLQHYTRERIPCMAAVSLTKVTQASEHVRLLHAAVSKWDTAGMKTLLQFKCVIRLSK